MTKLPGAKGYEISWGWRGGSFPVVWANITPLTFSKQTMAVQNAHVQQVHMGEFNKSHANYLWVIVSQSTMVDSRRVIHTSWAQANDMTPHRPWESPQFYGDSPRLGTTSGFIEGWFHVTMDVSQETPMWMDESQFEHPGDGYLNLFLSGGNKHSLTSNFRVPRDRVLTHYLRVQPWKAPP